MHGLVAMFLLSAAQPPIITIPKDDSKPEGDRSADAPKIITIRKNEEKPDVASQPMPDQGKEIDALKAEVARLKSELADEREQHKKARERHATELAEVRAQQSKAQEEHDRELADARDQQKKAQEEHASELAEVREQQKKAKEGHARELADARAQLDRAQENLKAVETTSRKPLETSRPPRTGVVPAAPTDQDDEPKKPVDEPKKSVDEPKKSVDEPKKSVDEPKKPAATSPLTPPDNQALVRIKTAESVRIIVDGVQTKTTGTEREFITPELTPGRRYQYTVVAERNVGDGTTRVTRTISVRGGTVTEIELYP